MTTAALGKLDFRVEKFPMMALAPKACLPRESVGCERERERQRAVWTSVPPVEVFFVLLGPVFYWVQFSARLPTSPASPASLGPGDE